MSFRDQGTYTNFRGCFPRKMFVNWDYITPYVAAVGFFYHNILISSRNVMVQIPCNTGSQLLGLCNLIPLFPQLVVLSELHTKPTQMNIIWQPGSWIHQQKYLLMR